MSPLSLSLMNIKTKAQNKESLPPTWTVSGDMLATVSHHMWLSVLRLTMHCRMLFAGSFVHVHVLLDLCVVSMLVYTLPRRRVGSHDLLCVYAGVCMYVYKYGSMCYMCSCQIPNNLWLCRKEETSLQIPSLHFACLLDGATGYLEWVRMILWHIWKHC